MSLIVLGSYRYGIRRTQRQPHGGRCRCVSFDFRSAGCLISLPLLPVSLSLSFFFLLDLSIHLCKYSPLNLPQVLYRPMIPKAGPDLPRLNTCMFSESMCWIPRFTSLLNSLTIQWIPCIPEVPESICSFVYSFRVFIFLGFPRFLRQSAIQCTTLWNEAY